MLTSLSLYIFTLWKPIVHHFLCRDRIYFDNILVSAVNDFGIWNLQAIWAVHMRTLLARIHIHWPESKLTKSHINWKKVMKGSWYHMFNSLELKKIWVSLFGAPPVCSPHPHHSTPLHLHSAPCHILVHVKSARLNTPLACHYVQAFILLEGNRSKHPHFFQNKNYFTKTSPILFAKMACLIKKKFYSNDDIMCDVL